MTNTETNPVGPTKSGARSSKEADAGESCDEDLAEPDDDAPRKKRSSSFIDEMIPVLLIAGLLAAMLSTSFWIWVIRHWNDSTVPVPQGTVQRILFVGNLGIDSQIDTEQHNLLVRGKTQLRKGARVEIRKGPWAYLLCDMDSGLCEDMVRED